MMNETDVDFDHPEEDVVPFLEGEELGVEFRRHLPELRDVDITSPAELLVERHVL